MKCPTCNSPMKMRSGRFGPFWGCTKYPVCKSTINVEEVPEGEEKPKCLEDEAFPCWHCKFKGTELCPLLA